MEENLLLEQYGKFKKIELKESPYRCLLNTEIEMNPHQINAFIAAIHALKTGGLVLADEVGLGKTIEAGLVLKYVLDTGAKRVLIALPATLRKQWEVELDEKFNLKATILDRLTVEKDYYGTKTWIEDPKAARIIITSYDYASKLMKRFPSVKWDFLIIDEAHNLRNVFHGTKRAKRLYDLTKGIPKILLTATPLQNSLIDLHGLLSYIDPRIFGDEKVFVHRSLKSNHPKEWDRNTNYREQFFRSQIYSIFNDSRFICIDRPVVIKGTDGRTITDLDAVIIDKQSKQTALFQLKWQDPTNDTVFSLKSKAENYINSTRTWVNQVLHWIATSSNEEIARVLNVKKQYIHKETLFIFVMGRTHGNYSSENELSSASNVVYGQWYQFLKISTYLSQHDQLSLVNLFKIMTETVPNKTRIIERQTVFKYDRYHIHFGGGFFR